MGRSKYEYAAERAYFIVWGRWVEREHELSVMHECGLTWAGSPPSLLPSIAEEGELVGLVEYLPSAPARLMHLGEQVNEFATALREVDLMTHNALTARHRRIVDGARYLVSSEARIAQALYSQRPGPAQMQLSRDCERGYRLLRGWLDRKTEPKTGVLQVA